MKRVKKVAVSHPIVQKKIDRGLKTSVKEGALASVASNFSLSYFSPFALALNATAVQMGILHAVISLLPAIVQLKAAALIQKFSRKRLTLTGVMGKILVVAPLLLIAYLHWLGVPHMVWLAIFFIGLHYSFTALAHPAWFSWMGSLVPEEKRGKYFARRNRVIGGVGVVAMIIGALILDGIKKSGLNVDVLGLTLIGFGIVFVLSGTSRLWSWFLLKKIYEPKLKVRKKDYFSLMDFLCSCKNNPFGRFSLFAGLFALAVGISTPYWAVYMLRDLNFSYMWYMAIVVAGVIFQVVFFPLLGKFSDRFGNIRLVRTCSILIGLIPFLWMTSAFIADDLWLKLYLLIVPSLVSGFSWAGYNLALNNYIYDSVDGGRRGFGLSYLNLLVGIGGFVGAGIGAGLAWLNIGFMNSMLFIFGVSGIFRVSVALYGSKFLHEVRNVKEYSSQFWIREFAPAQGVVREVHNLGHLVDKVEHYIEGGDEEKLEIEKLEEEKEKINVKEKKLKKKVRQGKTYS
ncbi:MFS transporter [Methanococcoides sp. SA1]|nr:MFS transporter [Methanococcoides sp. SA1]